MRTPMSAQSPFLILGLASVAACFSADKPGLPSGAGDSTTGSGEASTTSASTSQTSTSPTSTSPTSASSGTTPSDSSGAVGTETGPGTTDGDPDGTTSTAGTTTGTPACDPLDDSCGKGLICDGAECVAPAEDMVAVPGGPFMMGCNEEVDDQCNDDEYPYHEVLLSSFAIDRNEVTADAYAACVDAGECPAPATFIELYQSDCPNSSGDQPVVCVDWFSARDYCEWLGRRLPTEAEWEKAARGPDGRRYPWGNRAATCADANLDSSACGAAGFLPVGSKPAGASPYGALDMAGNAFEWVADWYEAAYYVGSPMQDPQGPANGTRRAARSSSYNYLLSFGSRVAFRTPDYETPAPDVPGTVVGFRCAADP